QMRRERNRADHDSAEGNGPEAAPRQKKVRQASVRLNYKQSSTWSGQPEREQREPETDERIGQAPQRPQQGQVSRVATHGCYVAALSMPWVADFVKDQGHGYYVAALS